MGQNFKDGIGFALASFVSQLFDRESQKGMDPVRGHFGGRFEGKAPAVKAGVGEFERRASADDGFGQQEVEVQLSWTPPLFLGSIAAKPRLELVTPLEKGSRTVRPVNDRCSV
jgi:hypothetical protein